MKHTRFFLVLPLLLAGCQDIPEDGYANPGDPERQLVQTTEKLDISLLSKDDLEKLKEALQLGKPSAATLTCANKTAICEQAKDTLLKSGAEIEIKPTDSYTDAHVTLFFKHIEAAACDNRYKDNRFNSGNIASPQLGCSIRDNMLEQVANKQQFVNPALLDYSDGEKAEKNYQLYVNPAAAGTPAAGGENTQSQITGAAGVP